MKRLIMLAILAAVAWMGYDRMQHVLATPQATGGLPVNATYQSQERRVEMHQSSTHTEPFKCDGRTHCSQMTSCAEATYFLNHCPAVKMDGDGDGIPCERQWCQ